MGVTSEAGNAHFSGEPDFTLQWRVHVVHVFIYWFFQCPDKYFIGQRFWFYLLWYDFNVDECILGWGSNVIVFGFLVCNVFYIDISSICQCNNLGMSCLCVLNMVFSINVMIFA